MDILVILQTHSKGDNQHYLKLHEQARYCNAPKSEIQRRCTLSLVESMNYAKELFLHSNFELVVYDDHSDESAVQELKNNLNIATFKTQFIALDTHGIMPSILKCYEHGRDHGKEIVYFAQDDYLYDKKAIYEMITTMVDTSQKLGNFSSIYPYDDPYKYIPENTRIQSHIIQSDSRHWRTQVMTASCFMTHHQIIKDNWDLFEAMGKHKLDSIMEDETINQLFRTRGYYLFTPIPSLALHMQYDTEKDPFLDWTKWWDKYDRPEPLTPTVDKTVLNVGFGGSPITEQIYTDDLSKFREITLDIDAMYTPDIIADVHNISHIPDKFVDVVYSSHMIEHNHFFKVPTIINELLRITKDGGFVRLITPNLKPIGKIIEEGKLLEVIYNSAGGPVTAMDVLFGSRYHTHKHGTDFMFHKCGFTKEVFEKLAIEYDWEISIIEDDKLNLIVDIKRPV